MISPETALGGAALLIIGLCGVAAWSGLGYATGNLRGWVDKDFPEIEHTAKPTWLTGFRYLRHGVEHVAVLDKPLFLEYSANQHLGRYVGADTFARATKSTSQHPTQFDKDLVSYDFGIDLELLQGGQVALTEVYKRISITDIEPIIEEHADVAKAS